MTASASGNVPIDYVERTNASIDFVAANLDRNLTLEEVAKVACFSPFHFHRIFRLLIGETLGQFVKRLRLERALYLMSHAPNQSLTAIAMEWGFSSPSDFSRSFKARYGTAPSAFDLETFRNSRRNEFETTMASHENGPSLPRLPPGENPDGFEVVIRGQLESFTQGLEHQFKPRDKNRLQPSAAYLEKVKRMLKRLEATLEQIDSPTTEKK